MNLLSTVKSRSMQQASANTETEQGEVLKTYLDGNGNVSHADIRLPGQPKPLPRVPNSSGLRLAKGAPVTINWRQGSRYAPHITGGAGSAGGGLVAGAVGTGGSGTGGGDATSSAADYSATAFWLDFPDEGLPAGLTILEGANVVFEDVPAAGDDAATRTLHARPRVETALPDPTGLSDGTLVDLVDGNGASLGLYRLAAGQWIRRDVGGSGGGGGSDVTTDDRNRWDAAGTTATAAQQEVINARTRNAISGSFPANTWANLKNHLMAIWNVITARTADPSGAAVGSVLTYTSSGLAYVPPATGSGGGSTISDPLEVAHGGTGGATASAARANLGAAPLAWTIANFATTTGAGAGGGNG